MTDERQISKAVISRLPRYYRYLGELMEEGIERISSNELSARMKVTASQIRQDLNNFGGFGQQGYGYNVKYLYTEIGKILGLEEDHNIIIIGAGNLGQALANYAAFENRGFILKGIFDVNPRLQGVSIRGVPIRMMDDLKIFEEQNGSLQEEYNAWRRHAERSNLPQYKIDCAFQEARESFSLYCSLKETIPFLVMCRYELIYNLLEGTTM